MVGFVLFAGTAAAEKNYEVKSGDNVYRIAQNYQVDVNAVIAANPSISDPAYIEAGQTIKIPDETGASLLLQPIQLT